MHLKIQPWVFLCLLLVVQVRLLWSTLLIILERQVSLQEYGKAWIAGIKSMLGAIATLFFAWTINKVVGDAQTGKYLSSLVSGSIPVQFYQ